VSWTLSPPLAGGEEHPQNLIIEADFVTWRRGRRLPLLLGIGGDDLFLDSLPEAGQHQGSERSWLSEQETR